MCGCHGVKGVLLPGSLGTEREDQVHESQAEAEAEKVRE
jgi:hypothetical protein